MIARPRAAPVFYVDESIFSKVLVAELWAAGIKFDQVGTKVPFGAPDNVWLSHCGKHSLLALTRDQRIRYRPLEKQALINHGVGCFTFTHGQATAAQCAARIVALAPKMTAIATSQPKPFLERQRRSIRGFGADFQGPLRGTGRFDVRCRSAVPEVA